MVLVIYETSAMEHFRFLKVTLFLIFNLDYGITISNLMQLAEKFCISQGAKFVTIGKAKFQFKISPQDGEFVFELCLKSGLLLHRIMTIIYKSGKHLQF